MTPLSRTAIVMSRLPQRILPDSSWLLGLRAALRRVRDRGERLLVGEGTAGSDFVKRGAQLLHIDWNTSPVQGHDPDLANSELFDIAKVPGHDRALAEHAGAIMALGIRFNGHWHRLLRDRLKRDLGSVILVDLPELIGPTVKAELLNCGASLWLPPSRMTRPLVDKSAFHPPLDQRPPSAASCSITELAPFPSEFGWAYFSHSTRACAGPWPEQSTEDYLDSLLQSRSDADHSALATLERIVVQRRLISAKRTARGGRRVVSLTASRLSELPRMRCFRHHRLRWDFEPYGLCISRAWLEHRGARRVHYGNANLWKTLTEADQPFFQPSPSVQASAEARRSSIDWSEEREWRHLGDVDMSQLSRDDGLVFVPNFQAAQRLSAISPWPITLWPDPSIDVPPRCFDSIVG